MQAAISKISTVKLPNFWMTFKMEIRQLASSTSFQGLAKLGINSPTFCPLLLVVFRYRFLD